MDGDAVDEPAHGQFRIDGSDLEREIAARLADWAERDAEIGRAAEIDALESRNRKLEADVAYLMHRAASFEGELVELRGPTGVDRPASPGPARPGARTPPVTVRGRGAAWWRGRSGRA